MRMTILAEVFQINGRSQSHLVSEHTLSIDNTEKRTKVAEIERRCGKIWLIATFTRTATRIDEIGPSCPASHVCSEANNKQNTSQFASVVQLAAVCFWALPRAPLTCAYHSHSVPYCVLQFKLSSVSLNWWSYDLNDAQIDVLLVNLTHISSADNKWTLRGRQKCRQVILNVMNHLLKNLIF